MEQTVEFVSEVGRENAWTKYDKPWDNVKKADVEESRKGKDRKTSSRTMRWRSLKADERLLPLFGAHLALDDRVRMNPLLGTGGNAGKRDFAKGWRDAAQAINKPQRNHGLEVLDNDLKAFLLGEACTYLNSFQAGSWFGAANKIYNHGNLSAPPSSPRGKKKPFREGAITPWAMVLACEGLPYFSGGPSRQLGSRRQPKGAFPFVTMAMAPEDAGQAGGIEAEIWAPIWSWPITQPELRSLFFRGRTELGGKGATSSAEFAVAVMSRGVDAGITEFRRFLLMHTTSAQTFESRLATVVPVPKTNPDNATTSAIRKIVELRGALPLDQKIGQRWRFSGLRGPLEQALLDFAAVQPGERRTESAWALVDEMIGALVKVDRNRTFRSQNVRFRLLPGEWATALFWEDPPDRDTRLALAISSLMGTPTSPRFIAHRIGALPKRMSKTHWEFPEALPASRVWSDAVLTENLCAVADRRITAALRKAAPQPPFDAAIRVGLDDVYAWLCGEVDEERVRLWLDRLCVFDWASTANRETAKELKRSFTDREVGITVDGSLALHALLRPLASSWLFRRVLSESGIRTEKISTCACLGQVAAMLRRGDANAAAEVAMETYRAAGMPLADINVSLNLSEPERLLASLIIPVSDRQVLSAFKCWRSPAESNRE